jgi:endonuclease YncB( thermonuclease family)
MEILILIFLFVAIFLLGAGKRSSRRSPYRDTRKSKPRPKKTQHVKQYEFNPKYFKPFEGKAHVIDGDTIVVKRQKIRLAGVNAPELDQAWGQKSKWEMVKILKGKVVKVVPNGETSYDRIVATCYIDGDKDIGAELISRGLARDIPAFTGGKYKEFETGAGRRRVKPTPYNNNATKHPSAPEDEPKPHDVEVVKLKTDEAKIAQTEPEDEEISLVEKWDDVEIRIKPND